MFIVIFFSENTITLRNPEALNAIKKENDELKMKIEHLTNRLVKMNLRFELGFIDNSDEKVFLYNGLASKQNNF